MKTRVLIFSFVLTVFAINQTYSYNSYSLKGVENTYKSDNYKSTSSSNSLIVSNTNNSGNGSFRQAIIDANANTLADSILFNIPLSDPSYDAARGVFRIYVSGSELNYILRKGLVIDGFSQSRFTGNTNPVLLGTGGTVGVDSIVFPQYEGLEIELVDSGNLLFGLMISAPNVKVRGLTILGFGNGFVANSSNIVVQGVAKHVVIEKNILGTLANLFAQPDTSIYTGGSNILLIGADSGIIRNNLIAWAGVAGIYAAADADCWLVEFNESVSNGFKYSILDGMDFATYSGYQVIRCNKIYDNAANGLDSYSSKGYNLIENNSIYKNGIINWENSGIRVYGKNDVISKNIIHSNRGSGILITSEADNNKITQNSIWGNGAFAGQGIAATKSIGINLISSTENHSRGTLPFYTLNDFGDYDIGGNSMINFPVISSVKILPSTIEIEGFSLSGAEIEFFIGDTLASLSYPQGKYYLFTAKEGSVNDLLSGAGVYGPLPYNGINQGNDSCVKFKFSFPKTILVTANSIITATATVNGATSEFSPSAKAYIGTPDIIPVLDCVYKNENGNYTAVLGYNNPNATNISIPIGNLNGFNQTLQDLGQPTVFGAGYHFNLFTVEFANTLTWSLDNNQVVADSNSNKCPVDLSVDKKVIIPDLLVNDTIYKNDTITFQIILKNNSIFPSANIEISDTLPIAFNYLSSNSSKGSYNSSNGKWLVNYLPALDTAVLFVKAIVDTNGHNVVSIISQSQPDPNIFNNTSFASVTISNSSSGNDGGLESNGSLASKTASRNFLRHKQNDNRFAKSDNLETFTYEKVLNNKIITSKKYKSTNSEIINFIPQNGPVNSQAFISTPTDLIGVSNAIEVFSVDYFTNTNSRKAAVLAIATTAGTVYEHTKLICDRLDGATLDDIKHITINGYQFIIAKMIQDNGEVDYAISFIAYKSGNTYSVDNRWDLETYNPAGSHAVLNFQVWSVSEVYTQQLVGNIINKISGNGYSVNYINKYPATIPTVYVRNGYYKSGNLYLEIRNNAEATSLLFDGNVAYVEDGARMGFNSSKNINQNTISNIVVPVNNIFDIGFSMVNDAMGGRDILYYADGPWGLDYEQTGAVINDYTLSVQNNALNQSDYNLGRNASVEGSVKEYVSLFRVLNVSNKPVNLTNYNALNFSALGNGVFEVVISKKSVTLWSKQYKATVNLNSNMLDYQIPFTQFVNNLGQHNFSAEDIVAVTFIKKGNNVSFQNFTLSVNDLRFTSSLLNVDNIDANNTISSINAYPNPFSKQTNINFNISESSNVKISLYNTDGQEIEIIVDDFYLNGNHSIVLNAGNLKKGVYIIKLQTDKDTDFSKIVLM